ncbi:FAD-dependent thymidylate synthase [bacterium]|nr:FAD-dependent thymidylate synthase [bacterium]
MNPELPMKVLLAGFNLDTGTLKALKQAAYEGGEAPPEETLTPETISAAYARISRNPAEVPELRAISRLEVEKARKSNENIIFGLGHSSVAEHAVFNIDIVGVSRLVVEAIESHRLASYTEKSQRYIRLDGDIVIPPEVRAAGKEPDFRDLIQRQNDAYFKLFPVLHEYFTEKLRDAGEEKPKTRGKAFASEDARYCVSLATQAQLGMTINARTLEKMVRQGLAHPLSEMREFSGRLRDEVQHLAPSLVKYVEATEFEWDAERHTAYWNEQSSTNEPKEELVKLIDFPELAEEKILTALLVRKHGVSFAQAGEMMQILSEIDKIDMVKDVLKHAAQWDAPPREFELAEFTFELIMSASCFAQIKRHRMATVLPGPYQPHLGWTTPESIVAVGMEGLFDEVMSHSAEIAREFSEIHPTMGPYCLTNAHRRRVIFKANVREMYHFSRLREDQHAQWDIRQIAGAMLDQARLAAPTLLIMAVGKHKFMEQKHKVFAGKIQRANQE